MNDSSPVAKWRQIIAVFLAALMLFASIPLVAVADTVSAATQFRAGIFNYPNPADFGFADLEVGEAFTPESTEGNQSFFTPDFSNETTPTLPPATDETEVEEESPRVFDPDLRYPIEVPDEVDPEVVGLGAPVEVGQYHKTYQVGSNSYRTIITTDPNYFHLSNGSTRTVDANLVPASTLFVNDYLSPTSLPFDVRLPINLEDDDDLLVTYTKRGQSLTIAKREGDFTRAAYLDNAILYNDVFEGVDIEHRIEAEFAHISAQIHEPGALDTLDFEVDTHGLLLVEDESGALFFVCETSTNLVYALSAPVLTCANQDISIETTLSIEQITDDVYELSFGFDSDWLESDERLFPVMVNIEILAAQTTERVGSVVRTSTQRRLYGGRAHGYVGNMRERYLGVPGARDFGHARYLIYFTGLNTVPDTIPDTARIDSAHFRVWQFSNHSNGAMTIEAHRFFANWEARRDTIQWSAVTRMRREPTAQTGGFAQRARVGYQSFNIRAAIENLVTRREVHHGFKLMARNEAHSVSGFATSSSNPGSNRGFRSSWRPRVIINWTPEPQASANFPLNGTRGRVVPMVQNSRFGQINTLGTFVYGRARPNNFVNWRVNIRNTNTNPQTGTTFAEAPLRFPDSRNFENMLGNPTRTSVFSGRRENWQTGSFFTNPALNTYYYYRFRAMTPAGSLGTENSSDRFMIYRVTGWDTLASISRFYNVPTSTIAADNRTPDMLIRQGNTLFLRNPRIVSRHYSSPTTPNRSMQARINNLLNGQGQNAIFSLDPVNLNTGNLWLWAEDFSIDSLGAPFMLKRDYNSLRADVMSPFGRGWSFGYNEFLVHLDDGNIAYNRGNGSTLEFTPLGTNFVASFQGYHYELNRIHVGDNTIDWGAGDESYRVYEWEIRTEANEVRRFCRHGKLKTITDYRDRTVQIERDVHGIISAILDPSGLRYNITTDNRGRITSIALPSGGTLRYTYDVYDNLTSFTNASGRTYRYVYDNYHRMISWINPSGTVMIENRFDAQNRVTRQVDGEGGVSYIEYFSNHANGTISEVLLTDALGNQKRVFVDNQGRKTRVEHPDGSYETFAYTNGNPTSVSDRAGNTTTFEYDARGNITREVRADGAQAIWSYNQRGQVTGHVDFCGLHTVNSYDSLGNLTHITVNGQTQRSFTHDSLGRVITDTDALGNITRFAYTGTNPDPISITDPLGNVTRFYYDVHRNQIAEVDARGNRAEMTFDADSHIISETDFTGARTQYGFTPAGSTSSIIDARGFETTFTYSGWGYMESITDALGNTFYKTFDYLGNQLSFTNPLGYTTYFEHDEMGNVIREIDPLGNTTSFELDGNGNVISETDALGNVTQTIYCTILNVPVSRIDALGNSSYYTHDVHGRTIEQIAANGAVTTFEYDDFGKLIKETSPSGLVIEFEYNAAGWLIRQSDSAGAVSYFTHDALGQVISVTDQYGKVRYTEYDAVGNVIREVDTLGYATYFTHDAMGRVISQTDALGNTTTTTYDAVGNVVEVTDALGNTTRTIYDAVEQVVGEIDPRGAQTKTIFDEAGRAVQTIDALNHVTNFVYDGADNLISIEDALGNITRFEYDYLGQTVREIDALGAVTETEYDALGQTITQTFPSGLVTYSTFDEVGNLTYLTNNMDISTSFYFDTAGNMVSSINPYGQEESWVYDLSGNLIEETDLRGNTTIHSFDTLGNRISTTCAEDFTTYFEFDSENREILRRDAFERVWKTEYNALGQVIASTNPLEQVTHFEYDALGRQIREISPSGAYTQTAFDEVGNAISQTDRRGYTTYMEYDLLGRAITITAPNGGETALIYDAVGQVLRVRDPLRRVTHFSYDCVGNQVSEQNPNGGRTQFVFDESQRPIREIDPLGNTTVFEYDVLGRLISTTTPKGGIYQTEFDQLDRIVKQTFPLGGYIQSVYNDYGDVVSVTDQLGTETTYTFDKMGRQLSRTNALEETETQVFDERGNLAVSSTALGYSTYFEYDALDRVITEIEPSGLVTRLYFGSCSSCCSEQVTKISQGDAYTALRSFHFEYDKEGNLIKETCALGNSTTFEVDATGNTIQETDALGNVSHFTYDLANQRISERDARGSILYFAYDNNGNKIRISDPLGRESNFVFDRANNMVRSSAGAIGTTYSYDAQGNLTSRRNAAGHTTTFEYDLENRQIALIDALGNAEEFEYDISGNRVKHIRAKGEEITFEHDVLNRLTARSTSDIKTDAHFTFDADNRRVSMTDVTGTTYFEYDSANRLIAVHSPGGNTVRYEYDLFSNVIAIIYPDNTVVRYSYDLNDRLITVTDRAGHLTTYSYDTLNRATQLNRSCGLSTYLEYDQNSNLVSLINRDSQRVVSSFTYSFDLSNRITREVSYQEGATTTTSFTYDSQAQLISIVSVKGRDRVETNFEYDLAGNRTRAVIDARGEDTRTIDYSYNEAGELTLKTDSRYGTTLFSYDQSGNLVARLSTPRDAAEENTLTTYSFDALGRLEAISEGGRLLIAALYDADDNRVFSAVRDPDPPVLGESDNRGRRLFFAAGSLDNESEDTTRVVRANLREDATDNHRVQTQSQEHDLFLYGIAQGLSTLSHMSAYLTVWLNSIWSLDIEETRLEFSATNNRAEHTQMLAELISIPDTIPGLDTDALNFEQFTITRYVNDLNRDYPRTLMQYNEEGIQTASFTHDTGILGVSGVLAMNTANTTERFLTDGRGSITESITQRGDITTYRYDAFGNVRVYGNSNNPFTYNQERFDFASELQFLRARYVDLSLGRFISRDTVLGTLEDPRTHNLYLYVQNDPLNAIDPSGHIMMRGGGGTASAISDARALSTALTWQWTDSAQLRAQRGLPTAQSTRGFSYGTAIALTRRGATVPAMGIANQSNINFLRSRAIAAGRLTVSRDLPVPTEEFSGSIAPQWTRTAAEPRLTIWSSSVVTHSSVEVILGRETFRELRTQFRYREVEKRRAPNSLHRNEQRKWFRVAIQYRTYERTRTTYNEHTSWSVTPFRESAWINM